MSYTTFDEAIADKNFTPNGSYTRFTSDIVDNNLGINKSFGNTSNFDTNKFNNNNPDSTDTGMSTLNAINTGTKLLSTLGNLWYAHESNKLAKKTFAFNKDAFNKQWSAYQEDRARKKAFEDSIGEQYDRINGYSSSPTQSTAQKQTQTPSGVTRATSDAPRDTSNVNQNQQVKQYTRPKNSIAGA